VALALAYKQVMHTMRYRVIISALVLVLIASGCVTTGLSPRESQYHYPGMLAGLYRHNPETPAARPPRPPIRLAVAQLGESAPSQLFVREMARENSLISSVTGVPISGGVASASHDPWDRSREKVDLASMESHLRSALNLARDVGAEYLFVFGGAIDGYSTVNPWAAFDVTLIGACLIPGRTIHTEGKVSGALLDTRSGRAVFLVSADNRTRGGAPTFFADGERKHHAVQMRDDLIGLLAREFINRLRQSGSVDAAASSP
jgi:hypothetical protein